MLKYFGSAFLAVESVAPKPINADIPATVAKNAPAEIKIIKCKFTIIIIKIYPVHFYSEL